MRDRSTGLGARRAVLVATAVLTAAGAALLAGCSPAAQRSPLSATELHRVRQVYLDAQWDWRSSPRAIRKPCARPCRSRTS